MVKPNQRHSCNT